MDRILTLTEKTDGRAWIGNVRHIEISNGARNELTGFLGRDASADCMLERLDRFCYRNRIQQQVCWLEINAYHQVHGH